MLLKPYERRSLSRRKYVLLFVPLLLSAYTHFWNPIGFPDLFYDEGVYLRRAMHVLDGFGPEESGTYFDHPYLGQLFLASVFRIIGYPDSLDPKPGDEHSAKVLYLVPRLLMGLLAVIDTFLVYRIAETRYNRKVAFIASVLFAVMPIGWLFRRVLLDSILLPLLLTSILFALNRNVRYYPADTDRRVAKQKVRADVLVLLSGIFLGLAIFTKIPVFMLIPPVAYLVYKNSNGRNKIGRLRTLGLWFIPVILIPTIWPTYAIMNGEFDEWKIGVSDQAARSNDGLTRVLGYFFKYDPVLLILGTIGIAYVTIRKDLLPLLWVAPFFLFLYLLNYGTYFYSIPVLPAFCIALARLILEVPEMIESRIPIRPLQYGMTSAFVTLRTLFVGIYVGIPKTVNKKEEIRSDKIREIAGDKGVNDRIRIHREIIHYRNEPLPDQSTTSKPKRRTNRFGCSYWSIFLFVIVAGIGLGSTAFLVPLDASRAQIQAAAFASGYMEELDDKTVTLVSSPIYSWISYYVFNNINTLKSFTNVPQDEVEYDQALVIADNHMRSSMKKKNGENLWSLYNSTAPVIEFNGKLGDYDTRDYPYTNLLNMKEGAFVEIKDGVNVKLEPKNLKLQSSLGTMPNGLTDSSKENENNLLMHFHQHLTVTQDGKPMVVPANIGIDPRLHSDDSLDIYGPQKSPLHTHTNTGTIHVESKIITSYTLGEFLDIWGLDLDNKVVRAVINSKSVSDYDSHILKDGDNINLIICSNNYSKASNLC